MQLVIKNFVGSLRRKEKNKVVVYPEKTEELNENIIGKRVMLKIGNKELIGVISSKHGKYAYYCVFRKNLPGNVIGKKVTLL